MVMAPEWVLTGPRVSATLRDSVVAFRALPDWPSLPALRF
jgi:hypothetical protein